MTSASDIINLIGARPVQIKDDLIYVVGLPKALLLDKITQLKHIFYPPNNYGDAGVAYLHKHHELESWRRGGDLSYYPTDHQVTLYRNLTNDLEISRDKLEDTVNLATNHLSELQKDILDKPSLADDYAPSKGLDIIISNLEKAGHGSTAAQWSTNTITPGAVS